MDYRHLRAVSQPEHVGGDAADGDRVGAVQRNAGDRCRRGDAIVPLAAVRPGPAGGVGPGRGAGLREGRGREERDEENQ